MVGVKEESSFKGELSEKDVCSDLVGFAYLMRILWIYQLGAYKPKRCSDHGAVMKKIRLLIVDDNAAFRQKLIEFLCEHEDLEVIGEAGTGREALSKAKELQPEVVLIDVRMPDMDGLSATRALKAQASPLKVIILSVFDCIEYRQSAEAAGAEGYLVKASITDELVPAIRTLVDCHEPAIVTKQPQE
jgi:YesN/AraC family two-component response regulator